MVEIVLPIMTCPVCDNRGVLLSDPCPLCDGDCDWLDDSAGDIDAGKDIDESEEVLFTCMEVGKCVRVMSHTANAFFSADFSVLMLSPPRFEVRLTLGSQDIWLNISSLSAVGAQKIAEETRAISAVRFLGCCDACNCILRFLGRAEVYHFPVASSGSSAAETVCAFYDALCELEGDVAEYCQLIRVTEVLPRIFQVHVNSRLVLASMFARVQEFYESPDPSIRGARFSLDDLKAKRTPFEFYLKWPGFNLPSRVFEAFHCGVLGDLLPREQAFVSSVQAAIGTDTRSDYYVIGTCENEEALEHELAHGLYATNDVYRHKVRGLLRELNEDQRGNMRRRLLDMGYVDDVEILEDEFQAYMAGGDKLCQGCDEIFEEIQLAFHFHACLHWSPYSSRF